VRFRVARCRISRRSTGSTPQLDALLGPISPSRRVELASDDPVDLREILQRATRKRTVVLGERPRRGRLSVRWINARSSSRRRYASKRRRLSRSSSSSPGSRCADCWRRSSVRRMRCTSTPITPEVSPWPPSARDGQAREVGHVAVAALPDRVLDHGLEILEVDSASTLEALFLEPLLDGLGLDRAEEEPVEDELEDPAISCDLASVAASASRKSSRSVQLTSSSAPNASRISALPSFTPSRRSSSQKRISCGASPGAPTSGRPP